MVQVKALKIKTHFTLEKRLILSNRLISALSGMAHPYAKILVDAHNNKESVSDNSYIDIDKGDGMVSWLPAGKEVDHKSGKEVSESDKWSKGRQPVAVGKLMRSILQNKDINFIDKEIEQFVNEYKTTQSPYTFKVVKGKDITKYYHQDTYDLGLYGGDGNNPGRSLYGSCMRHDKCKTYFNIYEQSDDISMLCLFNDKGLLVGRALLWSNCDVENIGKITFMDRIYTIDAALEETFKNYATSKGWWFKIRQGVNQETHVPFREITNGLSKTVNDPKMMVYLSEKIDYSKIRKPYVDTLRFFGYKMEGEGLVPVLLSHRNDKDRSPKDLNWVEKWDRLDGGAQNNSNYHRKRDIYNKMLPKKPFIAYENGYYWSDIETPENIFTGNGHLTENYQTCMVLFDETNTPQAYVAMNYESNDYTRFQIGDRIKNISKRKLSKEYHDYVVDVLAHAHVKIGNINNWIKHMKGDSHNLMLSEILSDSLNEKLVLNKIELFKGGIENYNISQLILVAKHDDTFSERLTIKNVIDFAKSSLLDGESLNKIGAKFNIIFENNKLWLVLNDLQIKELYEYGLEDGVENLVKTPRGGLLELDYTWDYSNGDFIASKDIKKGDIVKLKPGNSHMSQSQGTTGIVDSIKSSGTSFNVTWKNGHNNGYSINDLLVQKSTDTFEVVRAYIKKLKKKMVWIELTDTNLVGIDTRVKLKPTSVYASQAPDIYGKITQVLNREPWEDEYYPYNVVWADGSENGYRSSDLTAEI